METRTLSGYYVLITGGGTVAPVDAVRVMANDAEGDTAVAVAKQFVTQGIKVVLVLSRLAWYKHRHDLPKGIVVLVYYTYADYVARIRQAVAEHGRPAYAIATAAVSDYGYLERPAHKTRSDGGALTVTIPPLPKEIDNWRDLFGDECRIVGFKLLTRHDDTEESLVATARRQNARARLDATFANFKEDLDGEVHPGWWVSAEGDVVRLKGTQEEVAEAIVVLTTGAFTRATTLLLYCPMTERVLFVLRSAFGPFPSVWAHPGGGEKPVDATVPGMSTRFATGVREVREEIALDYSEEPEPTETRTDHYAFWIAPDGSKRRWIVSNYLLVRPIEAIPIADGHEVVDAAWFSREEALALDLKTITRRVLRKVWPGS